MNKFIEGTLARWKNGESGSAWDPFPVLAHHGWHVFPATTLFFVSKGAILHWWNPDIFWLRFWIAFSISFAGILMEAIEYYTEKDTKEALGQLKGHREDCIFDAQHYQIVWALVDPFSGWCALIAFAWVVTYLDLLWRFVQPKKETPNGIA